jgi:hypothetical protein
MSDEAAASLIAEQERRSRDPEYVQSRLVADEKFKEESFGACLSVVLIALGTLVLCSAIIGIGVHLRRGNEQLSATKPIQSFTVRLGGAEFQPEAAASLPAVLNGAKRVLDDSSLVLPGSVTHVEHAVYADGVQVYAVPSAGLTDDQIAALQLATSFAAKQHTPELTILDIPTQAHYSVILAPTVSAASDAGSQLTAGHG